MPSKPRLLPLHPGEQRSLRFMMDWQRQHGGFPSLRDEAAHFGVTPQAAHKTRTRLIKKGWVEVDAAGEIKGIYALPDEPSRLIASPPSPR